MSVVAVRVPPRSAVADGDSSVARADAGADNLGAYDSSDDGDANLRSPDALRALLSLPVADAQPNADAQSNGDLGHALLVGGDDSGFGGEASARALAGLMQHAATGGSGHLAGHRTDAQTNVDAQTNGEDDDGRGRLVVATGAAHRPRRGGTTAGGLAMTGTSSGDASAHSSHMPGHRHAYALSCLLLTPLIPPTLLCPAAHAIC